MTTSSFHPNQSAASDLHDFGLAGIELNRTTERRQATRDRNLIDTFTSKPGHFSTIRQRVGDTMIRIGTGLAGEAARTRRVAPDARPRIDMA